MEDENKTHQFSCPLCIDGWKLVTDGYGNIINYVQCYTCLGKGYITYTDNQKEKDGSRN